MFTLFLTDKAKAFLEKKRKPGYIYVLDAKNSGCSGYKYDFYQSNEIKANRSFNGIEFYIEDKNEVFFNNLLIDLVKEGINERIHFDNPNAEHECGCGESFGIKKVK